jgi:tetratricopeptide (TPR) repeat protein
VPFIIEGKKKDVFFSVDKWIYIYNTLLSLNGDDQRVYYFYGNYLKQIGDNEQALKLFKQGISYDFNNEQYWNDLLFLEISNNRIDWLLTDSEEALKYFPENGVFYLLQASGLMQKNRDKEAILSLNKGIIYSDDNKALKGQFYALLGDSYYSLQLKDSAFYFYDEALKLNDRNLGVLNNYSYYLSLEDKDLEKAEKMSSKTVELEPGNPTYLDTYAWVLFKRQHYLEAKFIIERAIDNGGDTNDVIVEHYGDILFFNNDLDAAINQWNKALILGSKSAILKQKIELKKYVE